MPQWFIKRTCGTCIFACPYSNSKDDRINRECRYFPNDVTKNSDADFMEARVHFGACSKWRLNVSWERQTCKTCRFIAYGNGRCRRSPASMGVIRDFGGYLDACSYWEIAASLSETDPGIYREED